MRLWVCEKLDTQTSRDSRANQQPIPLQNAEQKNA